MTSEGAAPSHDQDDPSTSSLELSTEKFQSLLALLPASKPTAVSHSTSKPVVLIAAILNCYCTNKNSSNAVVNMVSSPFGPHSGRKESVEETNKASTSAETPSESLSFLNGAAVNKPVFSSLECTVQQVEDVKIVLKVLPVFGCTIMLNCCLAQLSTFSVEQAATMNTKLGSLKVPPASLPVFPVLFIMTLAILRPNICLT
ncbi:protein NRT1/ PTR FAMILY 4.6-like [Lotus japonicus]|uniref:protein NRT1/ PTR FAMILY 4.6-like n=1 Tax=Lotus japonicus TaxID=34305 RepID=UPI002588D1F2|nr:protein NRT1/ PTR FAMILY 4.6-like [Lotus japonicus]